jgi:putative ABC transport system substrate-binding protein
VEAFRQGLRDHGYVEGQNLVVEYRHASGEDEQVPALATELVSLPVDVIVAGGPVSTLAAKNATSTIPIVMASVGDPVGEGFVSSLARPGRNVTGTSLLNEQLPAKRLELLKQTVPGASRVAVLRNAAHPSNSREWGQMLDAAPALGVQLQSLDVRAANELEGAFAAAVEEHADGLLTLSNSTTLSSRPQIIALAAGSRLPSIHDRREFADAGALMTYGPSLTADRRRSAYYVDRILKGAKPADLPIEQPMTFDFVVNLKTAQALGVTFPNEIMLQVTDVIQ